MPSPDLKSALLVMDVQPAALGRVSDKDAYLARVRAAVEAARRKAVPVHFVVVGFRPGLPDVSPAIRCSAPTGIKPRRP